MNRYQVAAQIATELFYGEPRQDYAKEVIADALGTIEEEATKPLREEVEAAKNLLAVLHRDGGHHTEQVGFIQSCKDGERVWCGLLKEIERLKAEFREEKLNVLVACEIAQERQALTKPLVEALPQVLYALTESERALRAWTTTTTGMGANIVQEDRGRTGLALREIEKARVALAAHEESKK